MEYFDLGLAWNWEFDSDLANMLEIACRQRGFKFIQVRPDNLSSIIKSLTAGEIGLRAFFDRASDSDPAFLELEEWVETQPVFQINPRRRINWTHDKTAVHLAFLEAGISTPFTYLVSSYNSRPELPPFDLNQLGSRFAIKPATGGGGGEGVVLDGNSIEQVQLERRNNPTEKYLLQHQLESNFINDRQSWFRVLVCNNVVHPCWWDPTSHRYSLVTNNELETFNLTELIELAIKIASVCKMDLFSSEIALTADGKFQVVDYVNDPIDLRLQSKAYDGVPDCVVENIAKELVTLVQRSCQ